MSDPREKLGALSLAVLVVFSVLATTVAFSGAAAAAANVSISPSDDDAGTSDVTYTAQGNVDLGNQDTLQQVDVHLSPADVSNVGSGDVRIYIDGNEYTDGFSQFSAADGTVEFKLGNSRSLSDGDPVRVVVADVTNPGDDFAANVTLHDTGDDQFQEFSDSVAIDTPSNVDYFGLNLDETTVNTSDSVAVSTTVNNTGEQSGVYNASLKVDGEIQEWQNGTIAGNTKKTVAFSTSFSDTGAYDVTIKDLAAQEVTVTGPLAIAGGSATPSTVDVGTTVSEQLVFVEVANVSQDGNDDWHYVEFPNVLADGLAVNSVSANATSISSSPNLVDGSDDDGTTETVKFATSGDGGGDIDLNLTVDASVDYPDTTTTYSIDARTVDSGGDKAAQSGVATVTAGNLPAISAYSVTNPAGEDVQVSFDSDEQLSAITVDITDNSGTTVATLTESDFSESGSWSYSATYTVSGDGEYTATLTEAADADGNDGASGESGTLTIGTVTTEITGASADPATVTPGSTVSNQAVSVSFSDVSADGDTDEYYIEFPNALADGLAVNSVSANATSVSSSPNIVDGYDDDGTDDTVTFDTSADGGGTIPLSVTADVSVSYPSGEGTYTVDAKAVDSQTGAVSQSGVVTIEAVDSTDDQPAGIGWDYDDTTDDDTTDDTTDDVTEPAPAPTVSQFALHTDGQDVDVTVSLDSNVSELAVDIDGPVEQTLNASAFTESQRDGEYVYVADVSTGATGTFSAELVTAANASGDGAAGEADDVVVDAFSTDASADGVAASPWVGDGDSAHTYTVSVPDNASVVNATLSGVRVGYSEAFLNASGSVSSVSDSQNVAALRVISASGTVRSRMGGTDAVSVNVVSGEVRLDLSDVDSARKPTVAAGDRIVVRLRPVTNPETAGEYDVDIALDGADGHTTTLDSAVTICSQPNATAAATEYVGPNEEAASFALDNSAVVDAIVVDSVLNTTGRVSVMVPSNRPESVPQAPGTVATMLNVTRPSEVEDNPVSFEMTISTDAISSDADDLTVVRYSDESDEWERLDTDVVGQSDGTVSIEANASHTSLFAISAVDSAADTETDTTTEATDATTESTDETTEQTETTTESTTAPTTETADSTTDQTGSTTTSGSGPGFTVAVGLVALLAAALLAARRRD